MNPIGRRLALGVSMAIVAVVVSARAIQQFRRPGALTSRGETRWLGWAYRDPTLLENLERTERLLVPGEPICIDASLRNVDPLWLRVMTNYALWRQPPAGPCGSPSAPSGFTRIVISKDGNTAIARKARQ
jgi:hypothetical protein